MPSDAQPTARSIRDAIALQQRLRDRLVARPPAGFDPRRIGGADMSLERFATRGFAGIVVLDARTLTPVETAGAAAAVTFPYVPGLLSFRELPLLELAWARLATRPDVLVFDGAGYAHPRRFGLACHGGVLFDVPSVGCAKSLLVGTHGPLAEPRGATAEIVDRGEVVGMAVRTRDRVKPLYVSIGHLMDLDTAVQLVLRLTPRFREAETTRHSHRLVNEMRRASASRHDVESA